MELNLKLKPRKPRWWEKKWKPKKPILYILEYVDGKWNNTYWWGGNWRYGRRVRFNGSGEVGINLFLKPSTHSYVVIGRSGTTLVVDGDVIILKQEFKSLHPEKSEWTRFGEINTGTFTVNLASFDLTEEIKKSLG